MSDFDMSFGSAADGREALISVLGVEEVSAWNDAPERTQAEVVLALRRAAGGE